MFAAVLPAAGFPGQASAQSLNPTVEVTRRFETSLKEIHKSPLALSALDSLMSGTLDFDYSVFDRGLGEGRKFIPNAFGAVNLPSGKKEPVFLFDAGLGTGAAFPFLSHAAMDLALPIGKNFSLAVYGSHRGYFGNLSQLSFDTGVSEKTGVEYNDVIDMGNSAGISGKYSWKTGAFRFGVDYSGIMSRQSAARRDFNSLSGTIGVSSCRTDADYFYYRADVGYSYSDDRYSYPGSAVSGIIENKALQAPSRGDCRYRAAFRRLFRISRPYGCGRGFCPALPLFEGEVEYSRRRAFFGVLHRCGGLCRHA